MRLLLSTSSSTSRSGVRPPGRCRAASLELDLDVPVPPPCELPTAELTGTVHGCLTACAADTTTPLVRFDDGSYAAGPFRVWLQLVPETCLE